ncbi:MAG: RdgB/HAM1 family non-canonical purine NTP pyrophosphatase [Bacteroidia bacterium]
MKLVFATHNSNKVKEILHLIGDRYEILILDEIGLKEEIEETGTTIAENASLKSRFIHEKFKLNCFADDTGLMVDVLGGKPGIFSARYAGEQKNAGDNIDLLLKKLEGQNNRKAKFLTVISLWLNDKETIFEGTLNGEIGMERRGTYGFGYDPVFVPSGSLKTLAEFTLEEKNRISHRALAFTKLIAFLKKN